MKKQGGTITLLVHTRLKDLKVGDIVMTAEIMKVKRIKSGKHIAVVDIMPQCDVCGPDCGHEHIKHLGYGQQGVLKVVRRM